MPQTLLGLGWGVRVAQAVNTPEIGRARRPIRIQLVVLVDYEDDVILKNCLLWAVLGYFLERTEIRIAKSSEQFRLSLSRLLAQHQLGYFLGQSGISKEPTSGRALLAPSWLSRFQTDILYTLLQTALLCWIVQSTQIPGTATFLNRWGDPTVLSG